VACSTMPVSIDMRKIGTAGGYVPTAHAPVSTHLDSLRAGARAVECRSAITDIIAAARWRSWTKEGTLWAGDCNYRELGILASFETHRRRSLLNPWINPNILAQIPSSSSREIFPWCVV